MDLSRLKSKLKTFNEQFPRYGMEPCKVSEPYDLREDWEHNSWPNAAGPGVYVILSPSQEVLYVGKASCNHTIGQRLAAHFVAGPDGEAKCTHDWWGEVRYVCTIGFPEGRAFEAPALEEYLIKELKPRLNTHGRETRGPS